MAEVTPEDEQREEIATYTAKVLQVLEAEGQIEKLRQLVRQLVGQSDWKEQVRRRARRKIDSESPEKLESETVTEMIREDALNAIPNGVITEVTKHIAEVLKKKMVPIDQAGK